MEMFAYGMNRVSVRLSLAGVRRCACTELLDLQQVAPGTRQSADVMQHMGLGLTGTTIVCS